MNKTISWIPYQGLYRNGIEGHLMIVLSMMMIIIFMFIILLLLFIIIIMMMINMQLWSQHWVVKSMLAELKNSSSKH